METKKHPLLLIGRREYIDLPLLGINGIEAKFDTGAYTSSIHCENIFVHNKNDKSILSFSVSQTIHGVEQSKTFYFEEFSKKKIKNSFGELEERYTIKTIIKFSSKKIRATLSLSNREKMRYPVLIGRKVIKGKFIIDVNKIHTNGIKIKKAFKHLLKPKNKI
jgi:hypothetical protein